MAFLEGRVRETTNQGANQSKKAERIKIGGPLKYEYETSAVMAGSRGHDEPSTARVLGARDYTPVESFKHGKFGD